MKHYLVIGYVLLHCASARADGDDQAVDEPGATGGSGGVWIEQRVTPASQWLEHSVRPLTGWLEQRVQGEQPQAESAQRVAGERPRALQPGPNHITPEQAVQTALGQQTGDVLRVSLLDRSPPVYRVKLISNSGEIHLIYVDAQSGQIAE